MIITIQSLTCRKLRKNSTILLFLLHVKKAWTKNAKSKINKIENLVAILKDIGDIVPTEA